MNLQNSINYARDLSVKLKNNYLGTEHVFMALLKLDILTQNKLKELQINHNNIYDELSALIKSNDNNIIWDGIVETPRYKKALNDSKEIAVSGNSKEIEPGYFIISVLSDINSVPSRFLINKGIDVNSILRAFGSDKFLEISEIKNVKTTKERSNKNLNLISKFGKDLTLKARNGLIEKVIGRDEELKRIIQILTRKSKNNPVLIGEAGVGKTAIIYALAQKIAERKVPEKLKDKQLFEISYASILAGTKHRGELEERLQGIVKEVEANPDVILFIDEIHTIMGQSSSGVGASDFLKPALAKGEFPLIGATTIDEFRKFIEKDPAFERRFQPILVSEPNEQESLEILNGLKESFEMHHRVKFLESALKSAVKLSIRYLPDRNLPDKAIDLIDEAASKARNKTQPDINDNSFLEITEEDIAEVISVWTKIPVQKLNSEETIKILNLKEILKEKIIYQDEAIEVVTQTIQLIKTVLTGTNRPLGVFMFLGPTGVGKTYFAKILADQLFGSEKDIIRIDMSEYMEKHSVARLIGAPPGYIGYEDEGQLVKQVRTKPYSVILLDEIEKAHPEVFDIFLQVFDEGRLTDSKGRVVDFTNSIIIMTSNLGSSLKSFEKSADNFDKLKENVIEAIKNHFRPEFLNRIDEKIIFRPLSKESLNLIAGLIIKDLVKRLEEKNIKLNIGMDVIEEMIKAGFDPEYGARPLHRTVQNLIAKPIAKLLLEGKFREGDSISAKVINKEIVFDKEI